MKKILCLFIVLNYSCVSNLNKSNELTRILNKYKVEDTIPLLDLSNKGIKLLPDLSMYKVRQLDLSKNELDTINFKFLPNYIEKLNISNNKLKKGLRFTYSEKKGYTAGENNISKYIKEINLSNNEIEKISFFLYGTNIDKIDLSKNNLDKIVMNLKLSYLNVSYNPNLDHVVDFDVNKIDKIISNNIKTDSVLKTRDSRKKINKNDLLKINQK